MRTDVLFAAGIAALGVAGCFSAGDDECAHVNCAPCAPLATVVVIDARTGLAVDGVSVIGGGAAWTCTQDPGGTVCVAMLGANAAFDVQVSAPGYRTATAHVDMVTPPQTGCCPPCAVYARTPVALTAL